MLLSALRESGFALQVLSIEDGKVDPYSDVESDEPIGAVFSPDGRWVAYARSSEGPSRIASDRGVYVQLFPPTGARYQVPKQVLDFCASPMRAYDILPDGRFVGLVPAEEPESTGAAAPPDAQMRVVLNWFEELKARVPVD